jgi:hypothetical protein
MNSITESFHNYKGWDFRIRTVKNNGIWSTIFRDLPTSNPNSKTGIKRLYLREKGWEYMNVDKLIQQTKDFISNHEDNLFKSLERQKLKYKIA